MMCCMCMLDLGRVVWWFNECVVFGIGGLWFGW